ncbi:hypothetical protein [Umezawaea sp.]|uniref:hypothetical protein n=1 Tax=Umezawaea sp. TaxID=1955258 RepID=UPI002ED54AE3
MTARRSDPARAREAARAALDEIGAHRARARKLTVRCSRGHHVAAVYATSAGLVYASCTRARAHGSRDFADVPRAAGSRRDEQVDLLQRDDPLVDDALPASCECGPRVLSRSDLLRAVAEHRRRFEVT